MSNQCGSWKLRSTDERRSKLTFAAGTLMLSTPTKRHSYAYGSNRNSLISPISSKTIFPTSPSANLPKLHNSNIKVIARFRPQSEDELRKYGKEITEYYNDSKSVSIHTNDFSNNFTFDKVFGPQSSQLDVYNFSIKETIGDFFNGYNGTIFAYGQSGSGKSFTMTGGIHFDGITPRLITDIFTTISELPSDIEYTVGVSYMEIYMEQIRDLLDDSVILDSGTNTIPNTPSNANTNSNLTPKQQFNNAAHLLTSKYTIHEDKASGVYVKGLKHAFVSSATELLSVLKKGDQMRVIGSTNLNVESSRSHAIFQIKLSQKSVDDGTIKNSNLFLVDLAGSEKVLKTGALGHTLEEAKKINSSLSALGNVIYTLAEGKSSHIPYRDSKLTRILQESLGGNSRTSLIITCSPSSINEQETLSTLRFGSSAKKIKNHAHINTEMSLLAMKAKIEALEKEKEKNRLYIEELEKELRRNGLTNNIGTELTTPSTNINIEHILSSLSLLSSSVSKTPTRIPRFVSGNIIMTNGNKNNSQKRSSLLLNDSSDLSNYELDFEIERRDKKIEELESTILEMKMENLKTSHEEDLKLFKLEKLFTSFSERLNELERTNTLLAEDIATSTRIIEARNERISKLENILKEQQVQMLKESSNIDVKLGYIKDKLQHQQQNQQHNPSQNSTPRSDRHAFSNRPLLAIFTHNENLGIGEQVLGSPITGQHPPNSPKLGLNLRIVKPMRGGEIPAQK